MILDLDIVEKQILHQLDLNARVSIAQIAKNINISEQIVRNKFHQIEKKKIINKYLTVIDFSKLGFNTYKICFKLRNLTPQKRLNIIKSLTSNPNVWYVTSCDGKFELAASFLAKSLSDASKYLDEFNNKFSNYISEYTIVIPLKSEFYCRDYLIGKKKHDFKKSFGFHSTIELANIDKKDSMILQQLGENARVSLVEISKYCGISPESVSLRIKKLQEKKIIQHFVLLTDVEELGIVYNKLCVSLKNITDESKKKLLAFYRDHPNIIFANWTLGEWNTEIDFEVTSNKEFRKILMDFNNEFSNIIKSYFILNIYNFHKYNHYTM